MIPDAILLMDDNLLQGDIPPILGNIKGLILLNLTGNKLKANFAEGHWKMRNWLAHTAKRRICPKTPQIYGCLPRCTVAIILFIS
jgi:hypothetical protein